MRVRVGLSVVICILLLSLQPMGMMSPQAQWEPSDVPGATHLPQGGAPNAPLQSVEASDAAAGAAPQADKGAEGVLRSSGVMFIENVGQFDEGARFQMWGGPGTTWLAEDGIWITLLPPASAASIHGLSTTHSPDSHVWPR